MSEAPFLKLLVACIGGTSAIIGAIWAGYTYGDAASSDALRAAGQEGYQRGADEARREFLDAERRQETLARLMAIVRSPEVQSVLPQEANASVAAAEQAVQSGDLERAAEALSSGVLAVTQPDCLREGASALVEPGTSIRTCHVWGTTVLVGPYMPDSGELVVTMSGETKNVLTGRAFKAASAVECDFNFERIEQIGDTTVARVSFAC